MRDDTASSTTSRLRHIGSLIQQAREAIYQSPKACAKRAGISSKRWLALESGEADPTLAELELVAHVLGVPPHALLGALPLMPVRSEPPSDVKHWLRLRGNIIGVRLKQARISRGESLEQVSTALGVTSAQLRRVEAGRQPPLTLLERLMAHYGLSLDDMLDLGVRPLGEAQARLLQKVRVDLLDEDLRRFVSDPDAVPFLKLACRLRALSPQDLRQLAQALALLADAATSESSPADYQS